MGSSILAFISTPLVWFHPIWFALPFVTVFSLSFVGIIKSSAAVLLEKRKTLREKVGRELGSFPLTPTNRLKWIVAAPFRLGRAAFFGIVGLFEGFLGFDSTDRILSALAAFISENWLELLATGAACVVLARSSLGKRLRIRIGSRFFQFNNSGGTWRVRQGDGADEISEDTGIRFVPAEDPEFEPTSFPSPPRTEPRDRSRLYGLPPGTSTESFIRSDTRESVTGMRRIWDTIEEVSDETGEEMSAIHWSSVLTAFKDFLDAVVGYSALFGWLSGNNKQKKNVREFIGNYSLIVGCIFKIIKFKNLSSLDPTAFGKLLGKIKEIPKDMWKKVKEHRPADLIAGIMLLFVFFYVLYEFWVMFKKTGFYRSHLHTLQAKGKSKFGRGKKKILTKNFSKTAKNARFVKSGYVISDPPEDSALYLIDEVENSWHEIDVSTELLAGDSYCLIDSFGKATFYFPHDPHEVMEEKYVPNPKPFYKHEQSNNTSDKLKIPEDPSPLGVVIDKKKKENVPAAPPKNLQRTTQNPQIPTDRTDSVVNLFGTHEGSTEEVFLCSGSVIKHRLVVPKHVAQHVQSFSFNHAPGLKFKIPVEAKVDNYPDGDIARFVGFTVQGALKPLLSTKDFATPVTGMKVAFVVRRQGHVKVSIGNVTAGVKNSVFGFECGIDTTSNDGDCGNEYVNEAGRVVGWHYAEGEKDNYMVPATKELVAWLFRT
jgi:hypothetical protein